jgi:hypothetical protein
METARTPDYLAVIWMGLWSCWGRDPSKEKAIKMALSYYKREGGSVFKIKKGDEVTVNVVDIAPHDEVWWDGRGFWVGEEKLDRKIEPITRTVP